MDPPPPSIRFPNQSFTPFPPYINPQNPPLNYNPNFFYASPQNLPSTQQHPDLSATLSALNDLIHLSHNTLDSLSNLFNHSSICTDRINTNLIICPFNNHHRVPPCALFRHFLRCPSSPHAKSPDLEADFLLDSLCYPKTVESSVQLGKQKQFVQASLDLNVDYCFSLDEFSNFGLNFFYKDCPGVVNMLDTDASKRTFTVPGVLLVGCANFGGGREINEYAGDHIRLLPSELWAVRSEIEAWNDYPCAYSHAVFRVLMGLYVIKEFDFKRCAVVNSPRYGVVIDVHMSEHIFVLFKLCLKAIVREAFGVQNTVVNERDKDIDVNLVNNSFKCPVLVQVLTWLTTQLSVLYGELNGKFLGVELLKQCILASLSGLLLFTPEEKLTKSSTSKGALQSLDANCTNNKEDITLEEALERSIGSKSDVVVGDTTLGGIIYVSQVAAAVAALQERSLVEGKIRASQVPQSTTRSQWMTEHAYISKRADEERKNRPNYRPIIEHDGRPRDQAFNEETDKHKTREELLAEERDYKRRRMSYRGKKLKRSTLEVTRDIIEDYMEDIKQAGGIGCFVKEAKERGIVPSNPSVGDITIDTEEMRKSFRESSEPTSGSQSRYRRPLHSEDMRKPTRLEDSAPKSHEHRGHLENRRRSYSRDKYNQDHYSRSPDRSKSHRRSHEGGSRLREQDDMANRSRHHETKRPYSSKSTYHGDRSPSVSNSGNGLHGRNDDHKLEVRLRRNTYSYYKPDYLEQNSLDERYDPKESTGICEYDVLTGSIIEGKGKFYSKELDE